MKRNMRTLKKSPASIGLSADVPTAAPLTADSLRPLFNIFEDPADEHLRS